MKRVLTALVLVPFTVYTIFFGPQWFFILVATAMAALCFFEFSGLVEANGIEPPGLAGGLLGVTMMFDVSFIRLVAIGSLLLALRLKDLATAMAHAAATVLGAAYIFGAWRCAIDLRAIHPNWIFYAVAINWAGDIAAFYTGKVFGKHKLAPRISPAKTWEGTFGSIAAAVVFGLAFRHWLLPQVPLWGMVGLSIVTNIAGQLGDLTESALKRGAGVKDSGTMLPGHGGWLDRLDSNLFTLPVVYAALMFLNRSASF
jgi:phosphatidate cytidylyltransferase